MSVTGPAQHALRGPACILLNHLCGPFPEVFPFRSSPPYALVATHINDRYGGFAHTRANAPCTTHRGTCAIVYFARQPEQDVGNCLTGHHSA